MEKEETVIECDGRSYGKATIRDIVERCNMLRADNEALMVENVSLSRQIGGLKTSNVNYKKQVNKLKAEIEHYKSLDVEGDVLYEQKIAECERLQAKLAEANLTIEELNSQIIGKSEQKKKHWWNKII